MHEHKGFDDEAATWDDAPGHEERQVAVAQAIAQAVSLHPGMRALDVGCGTGALVQAARDGGTEAVAVELDPDMASLAASRLGTDVTVAGLPDLPFADSFWASGRHR